MMRRLETPKGKRYNRYNHQDGQNTKHTWSNMAQLREGAGTGASAPFLATIFIKNKRMLVRFSHSRSTTTGTITLRVHDIHSSYRYMTRSVLLPPAFSGFHVLQTVSKPLLGVSYYTHKNEVGFRRQFPVQQGLFVRSIASTHKLGGGSEGVFSDGQYGE
jgi:hypothetical protein